MMKTSVITLLLLCCISSLVAIVQGKKGECTDELPHLEAGHIQLTDKNYTKWKKDNNKLHVLGISDSSCQDCCHTESILSQLKDKFD